MRNWPFDCVLRNYVFDCVMGLDCLCDGNWTVYVMGTGLFM